MATVLEQIAQLSNLQEDFQAELQQVQVNIGASMQQRKNNMDANELAYLHRAEKHKGRRQGTIPNFGWVVSSTWQYELITNQASRRWGWASTLWHSV
jgi:hypothetical protein